MFFFVAIQYAFVEIGRLVDIDIPWTSFDVLRDTIISGDSKKSWARRRAILDRMLACDAIQGSTLPDILNSYVIRVCLSKKKGAPSSDKCDLTVADNHGAIKISKTEKASQQQAALGCIRPVEQISTSAPEFDLFSDLENIEWGDASSSS